MRPWLLPLIFVMGCHGEREVSPRGGVDCVAACVQIRAICDAQECSSDVRDMAAPSPGGKPCEEWRCLQGYPPEKNACLARARTPNEARACSGVGR